MNLYQSQDDGQLYQEVDEPERFNVIEVPEIVTLTAAELCGGYGNIVEILLRANKARLVRSATA